MALRLAQNPQASPTRPGELLQRLIRNYLEFEPGEIRRQPIILVVNPDIFYYALYFRYGAHDRRNIFAETGVVPSRALTRWQRQRSLGMGGSATGRAIAMGDVTWLTESTRLAQMKRQAVFPSLSP